MKHHNMAPRLLTIASIISSTMLMASTVQAAPAQSGTTAHFTTQIYIANPNAASATAVVNFYSQLSGTADSFNVPVNLNAFGSTTVLIGGLSAGFKGSAVVSSDQNVVASAAQIPVDGLTNRPMYSAFSSGAPSIYLSTFLANRNNQFSIFGVQNIESEAINIRAKFIENGTTIDDITMSVPSYASKFFDSTQPTSTISSNFANYMYTHSGGFSGSVVVTATKQSNGSAANIVGVSQEMRSDNGSAISFEAIPQSDGATTVYMPSGLCNATTQSQTTYYAVQNMGNINASLVITYISGATGNVAGVERTTSIIPGGKLSVNPCELTAGSTGTAPGAGFNGSAIIQSGQPLNAVAKKQSTASTYGNFTTAFEGKGVGGSKVSIPYIRWGTNTGQNGDITTYIAVQNIGASALSAGSIQVKFYADNGTLAMTCSSQGSTNPNAKVNAARGVAYATTTCNPAVANTAFSGNVIVEGPSGSSLLVIATNQLGGYTYQTEDVNGTVIP